MTQNYKKKVDVETSGVSLTGELCFPAMAWGLVIFVHGNGSSRLSPQDRYVAEKLNDYRLATLLADLLTQDEKQVDGVIRESHSEMEILRRRLNGLVEWAASNELTRRLAKGFFGASTGAAGALMATADKPDIIRAVVSLGGRPDMAAESLSRVNAPTLLIVGGHDEQIIEFNRLAQTAMKGMNEIRVVPGASHLFEEPGKLNKVAELAGRWFARYLGNAMPCKESFTRIFRNRI